jgi:CHASE2 domain-containing sensor protein
LKNSFDKSFGFAAAFLALVVTISYGYCLSGYFLPMIPGMFAYRVMNGVSPSAFR